MKYPLCPHCGEPLKAFQLPENTGWEGEFQLACFNDECPYYERGWQHMEEHYAVKASYRFRINPETGHPSPLAVWSPDALKDRILDMDSTEPEPTSQETNDPGGGNTG
jgi:hypothetical protein